MTPRFAHPRFEENQVLSYQHLNQLSDYLEGEDRLSRRALIGAGVVCGLELDGAPRRGLRLSRGTALTTDGWLCHLEADLVFTCAREYHLPAGYRPFQGAGRARGAPLPLWELLEAPAAAGPGVTALAESGGAGFLEDKALLLYLELTTADLDTCVDNHCINQGQEVRGVWRVLVASRADLAALRQRALGEAVPAPAFALADLRAERLCLRSADALSHAALSQRGLDFIRQSRDRLLPALQTAVRLYGTGLDIPASTTTRAVEALGTGLDRWLASVAAGHRLGWQHGLDHLRHLYRAWDEFVDAAFAAVSEPAPLREPFPRHVLLGGVPTVRQGEPDSLRHAFVPSPALTLGGRDRERCQHRFQRLLTLCGSFGDPAAPEVRVTPGAALAHPLESQAVPFYYQPAAALAWWNEDATRRGRGNRLPCYHREALLADPAVRDPLRYSGDVREFYRIEGHQGRPCREVEATLEALRREYQLAFNVVTVTFGAVESETTHCLCELDEIKTLFGVSAAEMRCHLARLLGFLGGLVKPARPGATILDKDVRPDGTTGLALDLQQVEFVTFEFAATATAAPKAAGTATRAAAAPAAMAMESGTAQDLRSVQIDNLLLSYPTVSATLYPLLTPGALVNSLARELMGRLTEADGDLAAAVEAFAADPFANTMQIARAKAADLADALAALPADVPAEVRKPRELLRQELLLFLANCVPTRLVQIATLYAAALERLRTTPTLASFLLQHPGLQHLGGVPRGGTLVLVRGPRPQTRPGIERPDVALADLAGIGFGASATKGQSLVPSSERLALTGTSRTPAGSISEQLLLKRYGYYQASAGTNALVQKLGAAAQLPAADKALLAEHYTPAVTAPETPGVDLAAIFERLRDFFGAGTGAEADLVLADFCLPYPCSPECTCTTTVVLPPAPASLTLPAAAYCANDPGPHPFTLSPAGGVVTGPGVVMVAGSPAFSPAAVTPGDVVNERVTFTCRFPAGTTTSLDVALHQPPGLDLASTEPVAVNGGFSVGFDGGAPANATLVWDFGDGSPAQTGPTPTHVYAQPGAYTVRVTATRGPCTVQRALAFKLSAPSAPAPTIRLEGTDATIFCGNDDREYPVLTSPTGGQLLLNGTAVGGTRPVFVPAKLGDAPRAEWSYRTPDGQTATLPLRVVAPPTAAFTSEIVAASASRVVVRFLNRSEGAEKSFWRFGDNSAGQAIEDTEFEHVFTQRSVFEVSLRVTRGPCEAAVTRELDLRKPEAPVLTFDPTRLDTALNDTIEFEVLGAANAATTAGIRELNARAAATTDPAERERLDTAAAEREIGAAAAALLKPLGKVLLDQAAPLSPRLRDQLWDVAQIPMTATLYLAAARTRDLTATGELAAALGTLTTLVTRLRQTAHGAALTPGPDLASLLTTASADASRPVLQAAGAELNAAFGRSRSVRRTLPASAEQGPSAPRRGPSTPRRRSPRKP